MEPGREYMQEKTAPPSLNTHSSEVDEMTFQAIKTSVKTSVLKFVRDEDGLTIVEYAVAGGLITLGAVGAFVILGNNVDTQITKLGNCVMGGTGC